MSNSAADAALLAQYARSQDADAFAEMVRRYAGMVYGTCLRILRNAHDAEDMAQECFLALARSAGAITSSLPGWLHAAATTRSLNAIRNAATRERHEERAMEQRSRNSDPTWAEVAPLVDQALEGLPDELRAPLVLHYLQGHSQADIASELGVNQATISRRLDRGISELREKLRSAGVSASVGLLAIFLSANAAQAAPTSLLTALGKMALAGVGGAAPATAGATTPMALTATTFLGSVSGKLVAAAVVCFIVIAGGLAYKAAMRPRPEAGPANGLARSPIGPKPGNEAPAAKGKEGSVVDEKKGRLKRMGNRVWIEGVEKVQIGGAAGRQNSVMASLTAALRAVGEDITYEYLMGVSGAAFRLQIAQADWCPESPFAGVGFSCIVPGMKAVGRTLTDFGANEGDAEAERRRRAAVVESINKGYPALFIKEEAGVIVGYVDGGKEFLRDYYLDRSEGYFQFDKWGWGGAGIMSEKGKTPSRPESLLRSLEIAVEIADTKQYENQASGFAAYQAWIAGLLDEPKFEKMDKEKLRTAIISNAWCYVSLTDARGTAARYLRSIAGDFKAEGAKPLYEAADLYDEIHVRLSDGRGNAPFPWDLKEGQHWTKEMRQAEAGILKEASALERKAVDALRKALEAEKGVPRR